MNDQQKYLTECPRKFNDRQRKKKNFIKKEYERKNYRKKKKIIVLNYPSKWSFKNLDIFSSFISISLLRLMLWRVKTIFSPLSLSRSALIFLKDLSETSERDANCLCKDSLESFNSLIPFWASSKRSKRLLYKLESSSYLSSFFRPQMLVFLVL